MMVASHLVQAAWALMDLPNSAYLHYPKGLIRSRQYMVEMVILMAAIQVRLAR